MSISRFRHFCPAPALQATVPPEIVKSQNVHVRKTGSRAQNQDFICLKFFKPTLRGSHAPISGNAALPMGAGEATIVLRSTYGASSCDKILKYIPHGPPVKPSSSGAYGPDDMRDPHEKELGPVGNSPVFTRLSPLGPLSILLIMFLAFAIRINIHCVLTSISTVIKFVTTSGVPDLDQCLIRVGTISIYGSKTWPFKLLWV
ncbi:hypothetical protein C8J57DRAFT_1466644 [Mycena rebaudengoi]|nr:hypothetical protein C8J57DRAFT_1466644 [Mycena rebaudengoi]